MTASLIDKANLQKLPNFDNNHCFGCGSSNPIGLKMEFFTDKSKVYSWLDVPAELCGWSNLVHGGIISTLLDEIMSWSAIFLVKKIILTKSMEVKFIRPLMIGNTIRVEGSLANIINNREAELYGAVYNSEGELCAESQGRFALFEVDDVKKKGLMDEEKLEFFSSIVKQEL